MAPFPWGSDLRTGRWCASYALPGVRGGHAAVDVDDVSCRFGRAGAREERDRLGDVFGEHGHAELRPALVEGLQLVLADAVGGGALGLPVGRPDARALDDGVGVDGVDADPVRPALLRDAAREMQRRRLRGRTCDSTWAASSPAPWRWRSATTTCVPRDASMSAVARPMPLAPPVITATLPASSPLGGAWASLYRSSGQYSIANASPSESE